MRSAGSTAARWGDQRRAELGVGAVRLIGELAQLRVALALGHRNRIGRRPLGLLVLGGRRGLGLQVAVGALDRRLDELAVVSSRSTTYRRPRPSAGTSTTRTTPSTRWP
jgi:hypothetical protein